MPKRLNKREFDDAVYSLWYSRVCMYGQKQAKKIVFAAYKILREQEKERKKKKKNEKI